MIVLLSQPVKLQFTSMTVQTHGYSLRSKAF